MSPPSPPPLAPGFRFHPTDEELVGYFLRRKIAGLPLRSDAVAEVELYRWDPWDLPKLSPAGGSRGRDRQWFFFSTVDRKYDCSRRANRATAGGYWKATGRDRPVFMHDDQRSKTIGMRKSLVFHVGRAPKGQRTDWVMHEFRLEEDDRSYKGTRGTSFVVCRVFKKNVVGNKNADERLAPLMEERRYEEVRDLTPTTEREGGHANDFEQVTTEAVHGTDFSTIGCEASSLNLNPPSDGLLAPGFRFHPTDEELVSYYLKRKVAGLPLHVDAIGEIDLYKWDPWDLPPRSRLNLSMLSTEWFFFCTLDRKYNRSSHQNNRATTKGFWKSTGIDRSVRHRTSEKIIGMKKTLVFHTGRAPGGQRTNWVMHEYRLEENEQNTKGSSFVVCRIFHKSGAGPRKPLALYGTEPFVEEELEKTAQDLGPARKYSHVPDVNVDTVPTVVIGDVVDKNCEHTLKNSEQVTTAKTYDIGSKVEIAYIRDKLPVAWYMATVIKVIDERVLLVEYESLKSEDDTLVSEIVSAQYIRPHPPPTAEARNFHLLDEVEAFYNGGWWPGVVAKVIADSRYNVKFMHWEEEIEFNHTELRVLYDWVDGRWIQASQDKPIESQDLGGGKSIGHTQSLHECNTAPNCGFPGSSTPSSGMRDEAPSMTYENENLDRLTFESQQDIFQPCKKAKKGETIDDNTQLLDLRGIEKSSAVKMGFDIRTPIVEEEPNIRTPMVEEEPNIRIKALVEKGCSTSPLKNNDVVSADSITMSGEISEDPPVPDKLSQELVSVHKPLSSNGEESHEGRSGKNEFLQMGQECGAQCQMVDSQQEKDTVPKLDREGDKGARQYTVGDEIRKNCIRIIDPPLEGVSMGTQGGIKGPELPTEGLSSALCVVCSDSDVEAQEVFNVTSSSDGSLVETSTSNAQPSEAQDNIFLSTEGEHSPKSVPEEKSPSPEQSPLPFEKCSPMWDSFESMEAFRVMPQRPHFRPLEKLCKDFREGMAIGLMVTFSNLVNSIDRLAISDSFHKFDGILKTLDHLERYGFDVQCIRARLLELIRLKHNQDRLADEGSTLKILLGKEQKKKEQLNKQIESFNNVSEELEKSLTRLREEKSNIFKRKRENDSELHRLEMDSRRIEDELLSAQHDFEATRRALS